MGRKIIIQTNEKVTKQLEQDFINVIVNRENPLVVLPSDIGEEVYEFHLSNYGNVKDIDKRKFSKNLSSKAIKDIGLCKYIIQLEKKNDVVLMKSRMSIESDLMLDVEYNGDAFIRLEGRVFSTPPKTLKKLGVDVELADYANYCLTDTMHVCKRLLTYVEQPTTVVEVQHTKQKSHGKNNKNKRVKKSQVRYIYKTIYKVNSMRESETTHREKYKEREYVKSHWERKGHYRRYYDKETGQLRKEVWIDSATCTAKKIKEVSNLKITKF